MCTVITLERNGFYFGRNMDIEESFGERVVVAPRNYVLKTRYHGELGEHFAIMGMGIVVDGYPLYADAFNEKGLCMAGLSFPDNVYYFSEQDENSYNICSFELIPFVLSKCENIKQVKSMLERTRIVDTSFNSSTHPTPLHWIASDKTGSLVIEPREDGLKIYKNAFGVLTNNPPFDFHKWNMSLYSGVSPNQKPKGAFADVPPVSFGIGGVGLAGDFSSPSRFVKAAYLRRVSDMGNDENEEAKVSHMISMLSCVSVPKGAVLDAEGRPHYTVYSSCMNADAQIYYCKRYHSLSVKACILTHSKKLGKDLICL